MNDNKNRFVGNNEATNCEVISEIMNSNVEDIRKVWLVKQYILNWLTIDEIDEYLTNRK